MQADETEYKVDGGTFPEIIIVDNPANLSLNWKISLIPFLEISNASIFETCQNVQKSAHLSWLCVIR
jgi:hypothetical protein